MTLWMLSADRCSVGWLEQTRVADALRRVLSTQPLGEAVVVTTRDRVELYYAAHHPADPDDPAAAYAAWRRLAAGTAPRVELRGSGAVEHLLRLACGLYSNPLGSAAEAEVAGQALARAAEEGAVGTRLARVFAHAARAARRARTETTISAGTDGLGEAAVTALERHRVPRGARVLVAGAGHVAQTAAAAISASGRWALGLTGSPAEVVVPLAIRHQAVAWSPAHVDSALAACRAVIEIEPMPDVTRTSTGRVGPVVIGIDELAWHHGQVAALRRAAVPAVERLIAEELAAWRRSEPSAEAEEHTGGQRGAVACVRS